MIEATRLRMVVRKRKQTHTIAGERCFVCYMDLDGFAQRALENPAALFEDYSRQQQYMVNTFFEPMIDNLDSHELKAHDAFDRLLWPYMFSDSWFIATTDDSETSLRQISKAAAGLFARALEIGMPAHGAIAVGPMWWHAENRIVLGPAIVHAHRLAEQMDCFGVAIHPEVPAIASSGATTPRFTIPSRKQGEPDINLSFATLSAHSSGFTFNSDYYKGIYSAMATAYAQGTSAEERVVKRYGRSEAIAHAMLG